MSSRRAAAMGCVAWALIGGAVAMSALPSVNADARWVLGAFSIVGPSAALAAAFAIGRRADRVAGGLLLASVLTPTYFAWALNVPALVVGLALVCGLGGGASKRVPGRW